MLKVSKLRFAGTVAGDGREPAGHGRLGAVHTICKKLPHPAEMKRTSSRRYTIEMQFSSTSATPPALNVSSTR
jgi:hypothetical protein